MDSFKFKFFDKKLKKFVSPFRGPKNVWGKRHDLGLWGDMAVDLKGMAKLTKKDNNFELYIKINNKFQLCNSKLLQNYGKKKNTKKVKKKVKKTIKKSKKGGSSNNLESEFRNKVELVEDFLNVLKIFNKRLENIEMSDLVNLDLNRKIDIILKLTSEKGSEIFKKYLSPRVAAHIITWVYGAKGECEKKHIIEIIFRLDAKYTINLLKELEEELMHEIKNKLFSEIDNSIENAQELKNQIQSSV
jgi:hypothetical protein